MISTEKRFGQYVLRPATDIYKDVLLDTDSDDVLHELQCSVPPRWTRLKLVEIRRYNHDTSFFRFKLPEGTSKLNLPPGSHMLIKAPNCEHGGGDAIRPYTSVTSEEEQVKTGTFELLVKRYAEWGVKESPQTHFLFTKTDHTYRPAGAVSNYIHSLAPGDDLEFKHVASCVGRFPIPLPLQVKSWTLIAVGVGVAPMISIIRHIFSSSIDSRITLLYGVRECADILLKDVLEGPEFPVERFKIVFCVGTRFANIHLGAKTKNEYVPPPPPTGYNELKLSRNSSSKSIGWVNEGKIREHGFPPSTETRVVVCGLPGVYDKLCGSRFEPGTLPLGCALANLSYTPDMVIKL